MATMLSQASLRAHPLARPRADLRALVLSAGGVTGALFEVGVLRALEELVGPPHLRFDIFIGVSGGASVAALLAQRVSPTRLHAALLAGDDPLFPLHQHDVAALDLRRAIRLASTSVRLLRRAIARILRRRTAPAAEARAAETWLPSGLFSLERYRHFFAAALLANGLSDDFRLLPRRLLIPATDLDTGERIVFGSPPWDDVPVSTAVAASSAIPVFFEPVPVRGRQLIDGDIGRAAHLDLALEQGATEIVVVSPLTALDNAHRSYAVPGEDRARGSLRDRGMWSIYNQAHRIEHEARLQLGVERALATAPAVRVHVIKPDRDSSAMFLANPMSLAARNEVLAQGYACGLRAFSGRPVDGAAHCGDASG